MLRRPELFDTPTFLILPGTGMLWVRYVLGVFPGVTQPGDLALSSDAVALMADGKEIGRMSIPQNCVDSATPK